MYHYLTASVLVSRMMMENVSKLLLSKVKQDILIVFNAREILISEIEDMQKCNKACAGLLTFSFNG